MSGVSISSMLVVSPVVLMSVEGTVPLIQCVVTQSSFVEEGLVTRLFLLPQDGVLSIRQVCRDTDVQAIRHLCSALMFPEHGQLVSPSVHGGDDGSGTAAGVPGVWTLGCIHVFGRSDLVGGKNC